MKDEKILSNEELLEVVGGFKMPSFKKILNIIHYPVAAYAIGMIRK